MTIDEPEIKLMANFRVSEKTYDTYRHNVKAAFAWEGKTAKEMAALSYDDFTDFFTRYLTKKKEEIDANSINPIHSAICKFARANKVKFDREYIRDQLPERGGNTQGKGYSTETIAKMLEYSTWVQKALIHFFAATGCRVGAIEELKFKHLKDMLDGSKSVLVYPNHKHEHITFMHSEAVKVINEYRERRENEYQETITDDSWLFVPVQLACRLQGAPMSVQAAREQITRAVKRARIQRKKEDVNDRHEVPITHGFRNRWGEIAKTTPNVAYPVLERMMDHNSSPMGRLYPHTISVDKLFIEYEKLIPQLMISDEARHRDELKQKEKETVEKLESVKDRRIDDLESRMYSMQELLKRIHVV